MQANKRHTDQNRLSKRFLTKDLTRIMQLNVEGFSKAKTDVIRRILDEEHTWYICYSRNTYTYTRPGPTDENRNNPRLSLAQLSTVNMELLHVLKTI